MELLFILKAGIFRLALKAHYHIFFFSSFSPTINGRDLIIFKDQIYVKANFAKSTRSRFPRLPGGSFGLVPAGHRQAGYRLS